jgi:hypothetical protein
VTLAKATDQSTVPVKPHKRRASPSARPHTLTRRDIERLADRLTSRGTSMLLKDSPELAGDLRAARVIHALPVQIRQGRRHDGGDRPASAYHPCRGRINKRLVNRVRKAGALPQEAISVGVRLPSAPSASSAPGQPMAG